MFEKNSSGLKAFLNSVTPKTDDEYAKDPLFAPYYKEVADLGGKEFLPLFNEYLRMYELSIKLQETSLTLMKHSSSSLENLVISVIERRLLRTQDFQQFVQLYNAHEEKRALFYWAHEVAGLTKTHWLEFLDMFMATKDRSHEDTVRELQSINERFREALSGIPAIMDKGGINKEGMSFLQGRFEAACEQQARRPGPTLSVFDMNEQNKGISDAFGLKEGSEAEQRRKEIVFDLLSNLDSFDGTEAGFMHAGPKISSALIELYGDSIRKIKISSHSSDATAAGGTVIRNLQDLFAAFFAAERDEDYFPSKSILYGLVCAFVIIMLGIQLYPSFLRKKKAEARGDAEKRRKYASILDFASTFVVQVSGFFNRQHKEALDQVNRAKAEARPGEAQISNEAKKNLENQQKEAAGKKAYSDQTTEEAAKFASVLKKIDPGKSESKYLDMTIASLKEIGFVAWENPEFLGEACGYLGDFVYDFQDQANSQGLLSNIGGLLEFTKAYEITKNVILGELEKLLELSFVDEHARLYTKGVLKTIVDASQAGISWADPAEVTKFLAKNWEIIPTPEMSQFSHLERIQGIGEYAMLIAIDKEELSKETITGTLFGLIGEGSRVLEKLAEYASKTSFVLFQGINFAVIGAVSLIVSDPLFERIVAMEEFGVSINIQLFFLGIVFFFLNGMSAFLYRKWVSTNLSLMEVTGYTSVAHLLSTIAPPNSMEPLINDHGIYMTRTTIPQLVIHLIRSAGSVANFSWRKFVDEVLMVLLSMTSILVGSLMINLAFIQVVPNLFVNNEVTHILLNSAGETSKVALAGAVKGVLSNHLSAQGSAFLALNITIGLGISYIYGFRQPPNWLERDEKDPEKWLDQGVKNARTALMLRGVFHAVGTF